MTRPLGNARTPYVVRGRYEWAGEPTRDYDCTAHTRLGIALAHVRHVETVWLQMVGGQPQPLSWFVIDIRDYSEYRPGIASRFGETDGTDEKGRPYARREHGGTDRRGSTVGPGQYDRRGDATGRAVRRG